MARPAALRSVPTRAGTQTRHWLLAGDEAATVFAAEAACRRAVLEVLPSAPHAPTGSADECHESVLATRLDDPVAWTDFGVRPELSDLVALHAGRLDEEAEAQLAGPRAALVAATVELLDRRGWCPPGTAWDLSGHLWYRAGTVLGWHTNTRVPGWRAYLTWVGEPGRSFFRYRDPADGRIHTSEDQGLDLRIFPVSDADPLWHCVWAGTDRHSLGLRLVDADGQG